MSAVAAPKVDATGALTAEWKDKVERTIALVEKSNTPEEGAGLFALLARVLSSALAKPEQEGLRRFHVDSVTFQKAIGNVKVSLALLYTIGYARKQVKDKPAMVLPAPDMTAPTGAGELLFLQFCISALNAAAARIQQSVAGALLGVPLVAAAAPAPAPALAPATAPAPVQAPASPMRAPANPMAMAGAGPAPKGSPVPAPAPVSAAAAAGAGAGAVPMADDYPHGMDSKSDAKSDRKTHSPVFGPSAGGHFNPNEFGGGAVPASAAASGSGGSGGAGNPFAGMSAGEAAELRAAMTRFEVEERAQRDAKKRADEAADAEMARKLAEELSAGDAAKRAAARAAEVAASEEFLKQMQRRDEQDAVARKDAALVQAMEADNQLKRYLREQLKKGVRIELDQFNTLNLADDNLKPDKKFDCIVCFEKFGLEKILVLSCKHFLCVNCTKEYFTEQINGGKVEQLKCSVPSCKHQVTAMEVAYACDKKTIAKYNDFLFDAAMRKDPNARWCPHKGCGTPMLGSKEHPMLQCPKCKFRFCFNCKTDEWHQGATCANYQKWKVENKAGDKKFEAFINKVCKRCPKCKVVIEKNEGCDHMSCRCGYQFYWSTLKKYP